MANTVIQLKHSTLTGNVPSTLANGEISINNRDGKFFYSTPAGAIITHYPYTGPAGLNQEVQFNDSGVLGSDSGLTYNKTTDVLTVVGGAIVGGVNVTPQIQLSYNQANSAFIHANAAFEAANVGGSATDSWSRNQANAAFSTANSKTFTFEQNTVPSTANSSDFWVNNDTGFMYQNFGNSANPVWAEVGPTGTLSNTSPGAISATTITASNTVNITYTPATPTGAAIQLTGKDTQGGTGWFDFLKATNTTSGATNPNKFIRLNSTGGLEIINSAYSATLLTLTDAGAFSVASTVSSTGFFINNKQAVNGPAFRAYIDGSQTITSGSQQKVTFGTETFDTNSNFSSSRFTPTVEGYYQLNATVRIAGSSGTGEVMITIWKNGSEYARGTNEGGTEQGANWYSMQVSDLAYANGTGDYFEIYIQQSSGGDRDTTAGQNISYFSGAMVRGA
jgi:hypothetical protein